MEYTTHSVLVYFANYHNYETEDQLSCAHVSHSIVRACNTQQHLLTLRAIHALTTECWLTMHQSEKALQTKLPL